MWRIMDRIININPKWKNDFMVFFKNETWCMNLYISWIDVQRKNYIIIFLSYLIAHERTFIFLLLLIYFGKWIKHFHQVLELERLRVRVKEVCMCSAQRVGVGGVSRSTFFWSFFSFLFFIWYFSYNVLISNKKKKNKKTKKHNQRCKESERTKKGKKNSKSDFIYI